MDNLDALESIEIEDDGCFYLVGYFQTARSTDDTRVMASMRNIVNNSNRNKIQTQKRDWDSLIIHFRLGDYLGENFGILSTEYYLEALSKIDIEKKRFKIFALSDDIDRARARHQEALDQFVSRCKDAFVGLEWLDSPERTFEEDWELMRKGDALILANSSFSWWAARLAYRRDIQVLIPQPWFRSSLTPTSIYPQDWLKIGAIFED